MNPESEYILETHFDDSYGVAHSDYTMSLMNEMHRQIEEDIMKTLMMPAVAIEPVAPQRKRFKTIG